MAVLEGGDSLDHGCCVSGFWKFAGGLTVRRARLVDAAVCVCYEVYESWDVSQVATSF